MTYKSEEQQIREILAHNKRRLARIRAEIERCGYQGYMLEHFEQNIQAIKDESHRLELKLQSGVRAGRGSKSASHLKAGMRWS